MKKILFLLLFLIFISCSKILDLKPLDAISQLDVFSNEALLTDYVNGCYNAIYDLTLTDYRFLDALSDNAYVKTEINFGGFYWFQNLNADNVEQFTYNMWKNTYSYIRNCNIFFEQIKNASVSDSIKNRLSGEMGFIRAYCYAQLLWFYGGVPIVNEVFDINSKFPIPRNTYDEVTTYIVNKLDAAASLLPISYDNNDIGRATRGAALALKARVLLYAASELNNPTNEADKWQSAANAAKAVIDLGCYQLHNNYGEVFLDATSEDIWVRQHTQAMGTNYNAIMNPSGYGGQASVDPTQDLVDAYNMSNGEPVLLDDGTINPASGYDPQNPYINRDPRFYSTILYNGAIWKGRAVEFFLLDGIDSRNGPYPMQYSATGYCFRKALYENEAISLTTLSTTTCRFFRLGELYLDYAEALLELGGAANEATAKYYINMIRERAGMPDITESGAALMNRYRNERRVELAGESLRLFDALRWKIAGTVFNNPATGVRINKNADNSLTFAYDLVAQARTFNETKNYLMPIPRTEITKSSAALVQNPGYN